MKFEKIEKILLYTSLVGSIGFGALLGLQKNHLDFTTGNNTKKIASVLEKDSWVKRKTLANPIWFDLEKGQDVYEGDIIWTGSDSSTKLSLLDKGTLRVDANSFIRISEIKKGVDFHLAFGSVEVESQSKGYIGLSNASGSVHLMNGADDSKFKFYAFSNGQSAVEVKKGKAEMVYGGKSISADSREKVVFGPSGVSQQVKKAILLKPEDGERVVKGAPENINFLWKVAQPGKTRLQVAKDSEFKQLVMNKTLDYADKSLDLKLAEGNYYWRVHNEDDEATKVFAPVSAFTVVERTFPLLLAPSFGEFFKISEGKDRELISFRWFIKKNPLKFLTQIATDENFSEGFKQNTFEGEERSGQVELPKGFYYWRVGAIWKEKGAPFWSKPLVFNVYDKNISGDVTKSEELKKKIFPDEEKIQKAKEIEKQNAAAAAALALLKEKEKEAKENEQIDLYTPKLKRPDLEILIPESEGRKIASFPKVSLEWSPVKDAEHYEVKIMAAKNSKGTPLFSTQTSLPRLQWTPQEPGRYVWKVSAIRGIQKSNSSALGNIKYFVKPPEVKLKKGFDEQVLNPSFLKSPESEVHVSWKPSPYADNYQVVAKRDDKEIKRWTTAQPQLLEKLNLGQFEQASIQVSVLDSNQEAISQFSDAIYLKNQRKLLLKVPAVLSPDPNVELFGLGVNNSVIFEWAPIEFAISYEVDISNDKSFQVVKEHFETKEVQYLFDKPLEKKTYYYRVRAKRDEFVSQWSKPRVFVIK